MFVDVGPDNRQISGVPSPSSLLTIVVLLLQPLPLQNSRSERGLYLPRALFTRTPFPPGP